MTLQLPKPLAEFQGALLARGYRENEPMPAKLDMGSGRMRLDNAALFFEAGSDRGIWYVRAGIATPNQASAAYAADTWRSLFDGTTTPIQVGPTSSVEQDDRLARDIQVFLELMPWMASQALPSS